MGTKLDYMYTWEHVCNMTSVCYVQMYVLKYMFLCQSMVTALILPHTCIHVTSFPLSPHTERRLSSDPGYCGTSVRCPEGISRGGVRPESTE